MTIERRSFLGRMSLGLLGLVGAPRIAGAASTGERHLAPREPWLAGLTGRHKQFLDVAANNQGAPLGRAGNFLNAYGQAYGLKDGDLNVVFCAHGTGLALVLGDELWSKYRLGTQYAINDPQTKSPATRNIFAGSGISYEPSVAALQKRGVRFVACMQSIARLSRDLAARDSQESPPINQALLAGLLPGVTPVPAAIVAANRAQESGLTYVYIG
jgi:intracellular sulfur oxidation DsrE/DsrF family protein